MKAGARGSAGSAVSDEIDEEIERREIEVENRKIKMNEPKEEEEPIKGMFPVVKNTLAINRKENSQKRK